MRSLSRAARQTPRSGIRRLLDMAVAYPDAIHLEIGQPDFPTPEHIIQAAHQAALDGLTGYTANAGLPALREAIAAKLARENGVDVTADHVVVTVGGMGGLFLAFRALLDESDQVLVPDPGWVNYDQMACLCGAEVVRYPLDPERGFLPRLEALPGLVGPRTRLLVMNSPANPTGAVLPEDVVAALVAIAREHDLHLLSDECYEKIVFDARHVSAGAFDTDGRVVSVFSFSKAYAMTGWRVGWMVTRSDVAAVCANLQEGIVSCASSISQAAAVAALTGPQDCIRAMVDSYRARRDRALAILRRYGRETYVPQGAFYLLVDIRDSGLDSDVFAERLLHDERVAVAPGSTFGPAARSYVRISLATALDQLEVGLDRVCRYIDRVRK